MRSTYADLKRSLVALLVGALLFSNAAFAQKARTRTSTRTPPAQPAATAPRNAYEYGYVAGYNDGYTSGKTDFNTQSSRDHQRSTLYQEANRGYEPRYGNLPEYQNGYRLGYELGYTDGYYGRDANAKVPAHVASIRTAQNATMNTSPGANTSSANNTVVTGRTPSSAPPAPVGRSRAGAPRSLPADTVLRLRLNSEINTKVNREGDKFMATVIEPNEYEGATVEGHIAKLKRSGRLTGQTELSLDFDRITYADGRSYPFRAQLERVHESEQVKSVDEEGNVQSSSQTKDTAVRGAGGAALGAVIGAIAGGGKGAAIGALIGASVGAGSVYIQGNKDLIFERGTEMTVRTFGPRQ